MKNVMASAGLLALGALGAQTVHAQFTAAGAEKPWSVAGTLRGFYDDNYTTAPSDDPARPKRSSFGIEIRPSVSISMPMETTSFMSSYTYSAKYFEDRSGNKWDQAHDFELFLNHNFSEKYSIDFADSFVYAQEPDVIDRVLSTVQRTTGDNLRNNGAVNFHARFTDLFGIVLGYANTYYKYNQSGPASFAAALDRDEHLVTLDTRWHLMPETTLVFGYKFGDVDHLSSDLLNPVLVAPLTRFNNPLPSDRDQYTHTVYAGVDQTFGRNLSASIRGGAQYVDYYNNPFAQSTWSPYADLSGTFVYMDGGTLTLGFHYAVNQTDETGVGSTANGLITLGSIVQDQQSATLYGTVVQKITPKLTGTLTGQFQHSTFESGINDGETDKIYLVGVNLAYEFTHYLSGELGYNYDRVNSDIAGRGYDRNRVYIGLTASY